jgi:hypothetical protein
LRRLVAGLAADSPDCSKLSSQFADNFRRDLSITHPMLSSFGELKSVTSRDRGPMGDDPYNLEFAKGSVMMSAVLHANGRTAGGILRPAG